MPVHITDFDALPALVEDLEAKGYALQIVLGNERVVVYATPFPKLRQVINSTTTGELETR